MFIVVRSNCVFPVFRRAWAYAIRKFRRRNLPRWRSQTILSYWDAGRSYSTVSAVPAIQILRGADRTVWSRNALERRTWHSTDRNTKSRKNLRVFEAIVRYETWLHFLYLVARILLVFPRPILSSVYIFQAHKNFVAKQILAKLRYDSFITSVNHCSSGVESYKAIYWHLKD